MAQVAQQRKLRVLGAVVDEYVARPGPVASKAIASRYALGVSSATIRADLAALEGAGLIVQPHTSAGRIPTDAGYRVFVDQVAPERAIAPAQGQVIEEVLGAASGLDDALQRASRLVAELTGQIAIVQYPQLNAARLRHLELVRLPGGADGEVRILVVVIADNGAVTQHHVTVPGAAGPAESRTSGSELGDADIARLTAQLNAAAASLPLADVATRLDLFANDQTEPVAAIIRQVAVAVSNEGANAGDGPVVVSGAARAAREHGEALPLLPLLAALEEQAAMLALVKQMRAAPALLFDNKPGRAPNVPVQKISPIGGAGHVRVKIGVENQIPEFEQAAVFAAEYGGSASAGAAIVGAIGPTRIDYPGTIASVRAVAEYLTGLTNALP